MAELEELNYLTHPHTSAGRIPTDRGYRAYVDSLTCARKLSEHERAIIERELHDRSDREHLWQEASRILSTFASAIGVVQPPTIAQLPIQRVELIPVSLRHFLAVIIFRSGTIRTFTLQSNVELASHQIELLARLLNHYLVGRSLITLHETLAAAQQEFASLPEPLLAVLQHSLEQLPSLSDTSGQLYISGAFQLLHYPELSSAGQLRSIAILLEQGTLLRRLLARYEPILQQRPLFIGIGRELQEALLSNYAVILARYHLGEAHGVVGIIGPKRIFYPKAISVVYSVARRLSELCVQA